VAHGSVEGLAVEELEYPIPRDAARRAGLDYLALGHWHSTATFALDGEVRMAYSGTHETTRFGERDSGNALVVEITKRDDVPRVRPVHTGALRWRDMHATLAREGDLAALWKRIEEIEDPASTLVRLHLDGVFALSELEQLERLRALSESGRFFHVEVRERGLGPAPADERWLEEVADPVVREAARRIAGELGDNVGAAQRRQALVELYLAMHEVAR
jgi:DNA repair exonuclease SbcCD nuclease subunit